MIYEDKFVTISEKNQKVYEAGVNDGIKSEYDRFWDIYQNNGNRTDYTYAFAVGPKELNGWTEETFKPKYNMQPTGAGFMFSGFKHNLKEILEKLNIIIDFSLVKAFQQTFQYYIGSNLPVINMTNSTGAGYTFNGCVNLVEIEKIIVSETTVFTSTTFGYQGKLTSVIFEGVIGTNGLSLQQVNNLNHESLMSIINCLKDYSEDTSGTKWAVTLGQTNLDKLTDGEKAIATEKGWTLA